MTKKSEGLGMTRASHVIPRSETLSCHSEERSDEESAPVLQWPR
jgi:hypothetical protein